MTSIATWLKLNNPIRLFGFDGSTQGGGGMLCSVIAMLALFLFAHWCGRSVVIPTGEAPCLLVCGPCRQELQQSD